LEGGLRRLPAEGAADQDQIAQDRVAPERLAHLSSVVAQRIPPILAFDERCREVVLAQCAVGHRVEQIVLFPEVPVDARYTDVEVLGQKRHAQAVNRYFPGYFERAFDDLVDADRPTLTPLPLVRGCLPRQFGDLRRFERTIVSDMVRLLVLA